MMLPVLIVSVMVALEPSVAAEKGDSPGRPDFVECRDFSWKSLSKPENLFWPAYFWYWNGPPTPDVLRQQLADMVGHDARSVCVVPMPHEFRPVTMNTSMDVDYQYVRGLTVLVCGVYPLSTRDHFMLGERPHFGPVNPLWDFLPDFHRNVARLGYLVSCGKPAKDIGLYYPVRDLWASAKPADAALHDALARALLRRQCHFDIVVDDVLSAPPARVEDGALMARALS